MVRFVFLAILVSVGANSGSARDKYDPDLSFRKHEKYPVRVASVDHLANEILIENNVPVITRDGTNLSAKIFRPNEKGRFPVVMAFTAYDKNGGPDRYPPHLRYALEPEYDFEPFTVSPWTTWEGPDPAFWLQNDYAVVYVDSRGFNGSEGKPALLSIQDRNDFYDAIEWAGTRDWSTGKVGLSGVSYLAISQWVAASGNPPHLAAIIPWEGQSDNYREVLYHGGIPETGFVGFYQQRMRSMGNSNPLPPKPITDFAHKRPWLFKLLQRYLQPPSGIDLKRINVPALICASWTDHGLHTRGSFEAFKQISSTQKWMFNHGREKWSTYYTEEAKKYQLDFFDHFLKGIDNGFANRKPIRLEIRESLKKYTVRYVEQWPPEDVVYRSMYLDAGTSGLVDTTPIEPRSVTYDSAKGAAMFTHVFSEETEIVGNMKLKLWVSTDEGSDMDLFVGIKKFDPSGEEVHFYKKLGYARGPVALGWLRVSQRALDKERSTAWQPVLAHEEAHEISKNEIVPVEIEILPSGTLFKKGESLAVVVQGKDLFEHPTLAHHYSVNVGNHAIHAGGEYDSHLLVPIARKNQRP